MADQRQTMEARLAKAIYNTWGPQRAVIMRALRRARYELLAAQSQHLAKKELGDTVAEKASVAGNPYNLEIDWTAEDQRMALDLGPAFQAALNQALADVGALYKDVEIQTDWTIYNADAAAYATKYNYELITQINDSTREQIGKAVQTWIKSGQEFPELVEAIGKLVPDNPYPFIRDRPHLIAATEATRIYADAQHTHLNSRGLKRSRWRTGEDELVCPICRPLGEANGGEGAVSTSGQFVNAESGQAVTVPAHPGCRCWVTADTQELEEKLDKLPKKKKPKKPATAGKIPIQPSSVPKPATTPAPVDPAGPPEGVPAGAIQPKKINTIMAYKKQGYSLKDAKDMYEGKKPKPPELKEPRWLSQETVGGVTQQKWFDADGNLIVQSMPPGAQAMGEPDQFKYLTEVQGVKAFAAFDYVQGVAPLPGEYGKMPSHWNPDTQKYYTYDGFEVEPPTAQPGQPAAPANVPAGGYPMMGDDLDAYLYDLGMEPEEISAYKAGKTVPGMDYAAVDGYATDSPQYYTIDKNGYTVWHWGNGKAMTAPYYGKYPASYKPPAEDAPPEYKPPEYAKPVEKTDKFSFWLEQGYPEKTAQAYALGSKTPPTPGPKWFVNSTSGNKVYIYGDGSSTAPLPPATKLTYADMAEYMTNTQVKLENGFSFLTKHPDQLGNSFPTHYTIKPDGTKSYIFGTPDDPDAAMAELMAGKPNKKPITHHAVADYVMETYGIEPADVQYFIESQIVSGQIVDYPSHYEIDQHGNKILYWDSTPDTDQLLAPPGEGQAGFAKHKITYTEIEDYLIDVYDLAVDDAGKPTPHAKQFIKDKLANPITVENLPSHVWEGGVTGKKYVYDEMIDLANVEGLPPAKQKMDHGSFSALLEEHKIQPHLIDSQLDELYEGLIPVTDYLPSHYTKNADGSYTWHYDQAVDVEYAASTKPPIIPDDMLDDMHPDDFDDWGGPAAPEPASPSVPAGAPLPPVAAEFPHNFEDLTEISHPAASTGAHRKTVYEAPDGSKWLYKPQEKFRALGDKAAADVARALGHDAAETHVIQRGRDWGSVQRLYDDVTGDLGGIELSSLSQADVVQVQKEHMFDWLVGNNDGHEANVIKLSNGKLVGIDKGQLFKFYDKDQLDWDYNPNKKYYNVVSVHNKIMQRYADGDPDIWVATPDNAALADFASKIEGLDDQQFKDMIRPYAEAAKARGFLAYGNDVDQFLSQAVKRKNNIRKDWRAMFDKATKRRNNILGIAEPAPAAKPAKPKRVRGAMTNVNKTFVKQVDKAGWQGKALHMGGEDIQDQHALVYKIKGNGTVVEFKVREGAEKHMLDTAKPFMEEGALDYTPATVSDPDQYWQEVLSVAKSYNYHLNPSSSGYDGEITSGTKTKVKGLKAKIASNPDDPYAKAYSAYINSMADEIDAGQVGGLLGQNVDKYVPPPEVEPRARRPRRDRKMTIKPSTARTVGVRHENGQIIEDRSNVAKFDGVGLDMDLGPGYSGHYIPHGTKNSSIYSKQGRMTIIIQDDLTPDTLQGALDIVGELGINNTLATAADNELLYLAKTSYAAGVTNDEIGIRANLKPATKLKKYKDYWAKRMRVDKVEDIPGYDPTPTYASPTKGSTGTKTGTYGIPRWKRFDISDIEFDQEMRGKYNLVHDLWSGNVENTLQVMLENNGALIATEDKYRIGLGIGGMSPGPDQGTGGASYCFTRIKTHDQALRSSGNELVFSIDLLLDTDAISYQYDKFGEVKPQAIQKYRQRTIKEWQNTADYGGNETIIKNNINLYDSLEYVKVDSQAAKKRVIALFKKHGIHRLQGRSIHDAVRVR